MSIATSTEPIATALDAIRRNPAVNVAFRPGIGLAVQRGMKKRQHWFGEQCRVVEYHGQNRATFECKAVGHRFKGKMFPKAPNGKIPPEAMLEKFARYWSGHVNMACPQCHVAHGQSAKEE